MNFTENGISFKKSYKFPARCDVSDEIIEQVIKSEIADIESSIDSGVRLIYVTHDFGYEVGATRCVYCPPGTEGVYFARRGPRKYLTRMVSGVEPERTSLCTVVLKYSAREESYIIASAWFGDSAKPELSNIAFFETCDNPLEAIRESAEFWMYHALVKES